MKTHFRAHYLDKLRVILTVLVIYHHVAIAYGAMGGWFYISQQTVTGFPQMLMSVTLAVNQAFFMSLFFFISAYLMPHSLERKGVKKYLTDRLIRLGIPLLLVALLINPSTLYFIAVHTGKTGGNSWWQYVWMCISKYPNTSHMWFVLALLIFETGYIGLKQVFRNSISSRIKRELPSNWQIAGFILVFGLIAFGIRTFYPIGKNFIGLQFGYFSLYTGMYMAGILAARKHWLEKISLRKATGWFAASLVAFPFIIFAFLLVNKHPEELSNFMGGWEPASLVLAFWESILCVGIGMFLLIVFREKGNSTGKFWQQTSADSYLVYTIHAVVVVAATIGLETIRLAAFPKFIIATTCSISTSFLLAFLLRKIPGVRRIF